jgi:tocopherol cyclase
MRRLYKIFHPEVFQGSPGLKNYFEGWYFKNVSRDMSHAMAFIPGISYSDDAHSFVQFIDGINGRSAYFRYKTEEFESDGRRFLTKIGDSEFSAEEISLKLENNDWQIEGKLRYYGLTNIPRSLLMPGIMGWYSYVPSMECNHGVVSVNHGISGSVSVNGTVYDFSGGNGYIEKDWGVSFPESWLWLQCNNFTSPDTSIMISIAKIPWRGRYFIGLISFLLTGGKVEVFATYNNASVVSLRQVSSSVTEIVIRKRKKVLAVSVTKSSSGTIVAPVQGKMTNMIRESIDSDVSFSYDDGSGRVISDNGKRAGYEEMERIFGYFINGER